MRKTLFLVISLMIFISIPQLSYATECPCTNLDVAGVATISQNLTVDTNTLFVASASNTVGIGTTSPSNLLHLNGGASQFARIRFDSSIPGSENWLIGHDSSPAGFFINNITDGANRLFINNEGNIGIGTATPSSKLEVNGSTSISQNLVVDTNTLYVDSVNNKVGIGTTSPNSNLEVVGSANSYAIFTVGAGSGSLTDKVFRILGDTSPVLEKFTVLRNGNVGISQTSPSSALEVNGSIEIEGGNTDHKLSNDANNNLLITAGTGGDVIIKLGQ